ncbi:Tetratricopeptide repeat protein 21B [Geodia barretti]|uniref:Tetratricopeptide repeat protein 21B n=1 Tax=Geodia barretti TaxID=519541 RepID=A0AA35X180_GEOBA|nr:Tetratricopeptide repeat protein 21B [Geodia barretti]
MQDTERAGILYYARERQYRHIYTSALELTRRHGSQPELVFWKAYSLVMEERESEGMREVEVVQESKELSLAAKLLLIYAHKKCKIVDREAVQQLESKIRSERTESGERALYHAALFLWLSGRSDKSREYCDRLLKLAPGSEFGQLLRGWIDLTSGRDAVVKKSIKYFEEAATLHSQQSPGSPTPVDVLLGKCCYYYQRHNFSHSLELASQAVAVHPRFLPPLVEKMRVQLALQDWDQAVETAQRCLSQDASCVEAHRVLILELLARRGDHQETVTALGDLMTQLDQCEPRAHWIYHDTALSPARLAGGNPQVLQQTIALVERAISLSPHSALYLNELAYQQLLCGKVAESLASYKKAFSVDETSVEGLAGVIHCQLLSGHSHEAQQQLEFLAEVQSSIGKQANVLYLNVLLGQQRARAESEVLPLILEARDLHIRGLKGQPLSCRYFELYNPQFLLWIAQCLVEYAPTEPALTPAQAHPTLPQAAAILESILTAAPALTPALLLLARVKYLSGEMQGSQSCLQKCLRLDSSSTEAHLLMAQIQLHSNNPQQSQSSLEMALSHSFEVKTHPIFQLISGCVQRALGHVPEALASLQAALKMSRAQPSQSPRGVVGVAGGGRAGLGLSERVTVYLEMVDVLTKLGRKHEAAKTMQDAIHEFSGTSEEFRISIANADLSVERGDLEGALATLKTVTEDKSYFLQAKQKMADIYLVHRKDRRLYISCFRDLAEKMPGPSTSLLLGDAFMNIQEPEEALSVYEKALKRGPKDSVLASKVGQALVKTHQYTKAISYYEAALKSEGLQFLRADLARLYLRLNHFDRAEKTIHTALSQREGSTDVGAMCGSVELLQLLAGVREKAGREREARQALEQARETQTKVLKKASVDQPDSLPQHKRKAADIASQLAKACTDNKDWVTGAVHTHL